MLGVVGSNLKRSNFSCNICGCCMILQSFSQVSATMLRPGMRTSSILNTQHVAAQQCCDMLRPHVAIVWPGLANAENAGPTMLGYILMICCDRLAGA